MYRYVKWGMRSISAAFVLLFATAAQADWEPTFVDNFDGQVLDAEAWVPGREILPRRLNFYDGEAATVENGLLRMRVLDLPQSDRPYSTPALTTQGLFAQQYGYFEIRARAPAGNGFWPAFWLMPETGVWTSEIDIAEFRGHLTDSVHYAFHYGRRLRNENGLTALLPVDVSEGFNNYAVRWSPDRIDYLFNGEVMHSVTGEELVGNAQDRMFLVLNFALSSQHTNWIPVVDESSSLLSAFEIDYVRVYQEVENGTYLDVPGPLDDVPNTRPAPYDSTAISVRRTDGQTAIKRDGSPMTGTLDVTAHAPNTDATISVVLTELTEFNPTDGRYSKSASIETRNYRLNFTNAGETQTITYAFDTLPFGPAIYSVDVLVRDPASGARKSLSNFSTEQYVDQAQPESSIYLQGFFRAADIGYANGAVSGTLQLQLQQALGVPFLNVAYRLVDIDTEETLAEWAGQVEHTEVGLLALSPNLETQLDITRSVALFVEVTDSGNRLSIPNYGAHVDGTREPPEGWQPGGGGGNTGVGTPPVGGEIPVQNWRATFVDNFDGDALNANSWIPNRDQVARRINQYNSAAIQVSDGYLNLRALIRGESDKPYTTGAVTSQGLFKQQYGYFEVRARVPNGNGFWPAFWLMPESGRWTSEIDIAEFRGHLPDTVHHAFHYGRRLRNENGATVALGADASAGFNTYAVYWTPERLDYLFNGTIVHSVEGAGTVANAENEMYMVLNLALASTHASGWIPTVDADTDLNQAFIVDYVRVFQADESGPFVGIPGSDVIIDDLPGQAYDATALTVERIRLQGERDILRNGAPISGRIRVVGHADDYQGSVTIMLVPVTEWDASNGRFVKGSPVATRNFNLQLTGAGDSQDLDYYFEPQLAAPQAYAIDILVRDEETGNRRGFTGHRFVQAVDTRNPTPAVFFDGFFRNTGANYTDEQVQAVVELQLQQMLLTPYLRVTYTAQNTETGEAAATISGIVRHNRVGLIRLQPRIRMALDAAANHELVVDVTDASGTRRFPSERLPIGGTGANPIAALPPMRPSGVPNLPPPPAPERNVLRGVTLAQDGTEVSVTLNLLLESLEADDTVVYNVKLLNDDDSVALKLTGRGVPDADGRLEIGSTAPAPLVSGEYRVVVFVFRNTWNDADRLIFQNTRATLP